MTKEIDKDFEEINELKLLTDFAVEVRYPEALYHAIPEQEASLALEIAKRVKEFILRKLV